MPYIPGIDLANFTIAAALDLNPNLFDAGATNPMRDGRLTEGETMAVAFDMLANHLRESTGAAGSNQTRQDGEGVQPGEALTMMRLVSINKECESSLLLKRRHSWMSYGNNCYLACDQQRGLPPHLQTGRPPMQLETELPLWPMRLTRISHQCLNR